MMKLVKRLCLVVVVLVILLSIQFSWWLLSLEQELNRHSQVIETGMGPVEYAKMGQGPVVLIVHGGGSGYDTIYLYEQLAKDGFTVICPSRPGYLRTPVSTAVTFDKQADLMVALLDALQIKEKVGVITLSFGGPIALQLAMRHPDRVAALVLQDAISHQYVENQELEHKPFFSSGGFHVSSWIQYYWDHWFPVQALTKRLLVASFSSKEYATELAKKMISDPYQQHAFFTLIKRTSPQSFRYKGLQNDLEMIQSLSSYPLDTITIPTLVTHSQADREVILSHGEYSHDHIPDAMAYFFEKDQGDGVGQLFFMSEQWPYIYTAMKGFLTVSLQSGSLP